MQPRKPLFAAGLIAIGLLVGLLLILAAGTALAAAIPKSAAALPVIDDFESGMPAGWFSYGDYGSGTAIATNVVATDTVPGATAGNHALEIAYTSAGWGAGTGKNLGGQDWHLYDGLAFWFRGTNSGGTYRVILSDNPNPAVPGDSAERFAHEFKDNMTGWRYVAIPWGAFFRDPTYQPGGAPNDGLTLTEVQAYALALPSGTRTAYADDVRLVKFQNVDDFEGGMPAGWFQYGDYGSGTAITTNVVVTATVPGAAAGNHALEIAYTSAGWGAGTGKNLPGLDWSPYSGFSFWFYGSNSGGVYRVILSDNPNPAVPGDSAERFAYEFTDNATGWRYVSIPWGAFFRDPGYQPGGAPNDGLTLTQVQAYALALPSGTRTAYLDHVALFGAGQIPVTVGFDPQTYTVTEGDVVTLTVALNVASSQPVTVTYATANDTAQAGSDYVAAAGQLVFAPGAIARTFTVQTTDDAIEEPNETVALALSAPQGAQLGAKAAATLTIVDNDKPVISGKSVIVDNFEDGLLPAGKDANNVSVGFVTWNAPGAGVAITVTAAPPAPVPGATAGNKVLKEDLTLGNGQWAGFTHSFTNAAADEWLSQDWSKYVGVSFWLSGNNTGGTLFVDLQDNRNPGSTTDDAERWSIDIPDNFNGWKFFQIPFGDFHRKDIGNGAPNDGFGLTEMHGYAIGGFGSVNMGAKTYYVDDFGLLVRTTVIDDFEDGLLPAGKDADNISVGFVTWNAPGAGVAITVTAAPPAPVPGATAGNKVLKEDLTLGNGQWAGFTHSFTNAAADAWLTQDWSSYEGICFWLSGNNTGGTLFVDLQDNRNPGSTTDDAERWSIDIPDNFNGWKFFQIPFGDFHRKDIGNGAPNDGFGLTEMHGYAIGGFGSVNMGAKTYYVDQVSIYGNTGSAPKPLQVTFAEGAYSVAEGAAATITVSMNMASTQPVTVTYKTAEGYAIPERDYTPTAGTLVFAPGETGKTFTVATLNNMKATGDRTLMLNLADPVDVELGFQRRAVLTIVDAQAPDPKLLDDFEGSHPFTTAGNVTLSVTEVKQGAALALPNQGPYEQVLAATFDTTAGAASFSRTYPVGQDWRGADGLTFWYRGTNSGKHITVGIMDNKAATTADVTPQDWQLVWSDEFNDSSGTPPNPNVWSHEIGDGTLNGIPGWGNSESQFYTGGTENAATDGNGNLVISVKKTGDASRLCWYGPCDYSSARLITANKAEFQYGRIESSIWVPTGKDGLWPAFWALGTNIAQVGWPQNGEIDIMEYVSRSPNEVFGTIHGPGYSGGSSIGHPYTFPGGVAGSYHTFSVEWAPNEIHWYVDGINYHNVTPASIPVGTEWVYNHPFYLILNTAIGGNFGGAISDQLTFPQDLKVDYVRVYGAKDTAERFTATFTDNFTGWQKVMLPFYAFARAAAQPAGAPNDGLTLSQVWGYGFNLPQGASGTVYLDQVRLVNLLPAELQGLRRRVYQQGQEGYTGTTATYFDYSGGYNNAALLHVGANNDVQSLLRFDLAGIPAGAVIDEAILQLYNTGRSNGNSLTLGAHRVLADWTDAEADRVQSKAGVSWNVAGMGSGSDYTAAPAATADVSDAGGAWIALNITSLAQTWVNNPADNLGLVLLQEASNGYVVYDFCSELGWGPCTPDMAPKLTVRYHLAPPLPVKMTLQQGVSGYNGANATYFDGATGYNDTSQWHVGLNDSMKALLRFNLPTIPLSATVDEATLRLYQTGRSNGNTLTVGAHRVLADWVDAEANKTQRQNGVNWSVANMGSGSDYAATADGTADLSSDGGAWIDLDVKAMVQAWIANPADNHGLVLTQDAASGAVYFSFCSELGWSPCTTAQAPQLMIWYH